MISVCKTGMVHPVVGPVLALGLVTALSGCLSEGTAGGLGFFPDRAVSQSAGGLRARPQVPKVVPLSRAELAGGKVVVQGPVASQRWPSR